MITNIKKGILIFCFFFIATTECMGPRAISKMLEEIILISAESVGVVATYLKIAQKAYEISLKYNTNSYIKWPSKGLVYLSTMPALSLGGLLLSKFKNTPEDVQDFIAAPFYYMVLNPIIYLNKKISELHNEKRYELMEKRQKELKKQRQKQYELAIKK